MLKSFIFPIKLLFFVQIKHLSVPNDLNVVEPTTQGSVIARAGKKLLELFSPGLATMTITVVTIQFTIQLGYYGLWLWFPELFDKLEDYYSTHADEGVTVCQVFVLIWTLTFNCFYNVTVLQSGWDNLKTYCR